MKIKYIVPLLISLSACNGFKSPEADVYLSVRIVNNELGRLLTEYHTNVVSLAQKEIDSSCESADVVCRTNARDVVVIKYSARAATYNEVAKLQQDVSTLVKYADKVCASDSEAICETAKSNVVKSKQNIEKAWKQLSSWVQLGYGSN